MNSDDSACVRDAAISHMNSVGHELYEAAEKFNSFAVAYKLAPFRDGNQWCVLLGPDIQVGVAGFGDTPAKAIADFERAMHAPISDLSAPAAVKESLTTEAPVSPAAQQPHRLKETSVVQSNSSAGPLSTQSVADDVMRDARLGNILYVWDYENPEDGCWDSIEEFLHDTTPNAGKTVRLNLALPLQSVDVEMLEVGTSGEPIRWLVRDAKTGTLLDTQQQKVKP